MKPQKPQKLESVVQFVERGGKIKKMPTLWADNSRTVFTSNVFSTKARLGSINLRDFSEW
jgi:hypothetical protein